MLLGVEAGYDKAQQQGGLPSVAVFEAHDVVLAQVVTRLHLDYLEWLGAGVGQAVRECPRVCRWISFSTRRDTVSPQVTSAVPRTTTQCSARLR